MTWLALYNYNFKELQQKDLNYLDTDYKYDLSKEEYIDVELKLFIISKNLRYEVI